MHTHTHTVTSLWTCLWSVARLGPVGDTRWNWPGPVPAASLKHVMQECSILNQFFTENRPVWINWDVWHWRLLRGMTRFVTQRYTVKRSQRTYRSLVSFHYLRLSNGGIGGISRPNAYLSLLTVRRPCIIIIIFFLASLSYSSQVVCFSHGAFPWSVAASPPASNTAHSFQWSCAPSGIKLKTFFGFGVFKDLKFLFWTSVSCRPVTCFTGVYFCIAWKMLLGATFYFFGCST